jgi:PAS domain S-box-containing protein
MISGEANQASSSQEGRNWQDPAFPAAFLEIAFEAVVVLDPRERITYWNPAAEQMYGWTAQEALGKTPAELFWPVSTPQEQEDQKQRQAGLERGETLRGKHRPCRKDGSPLQVQYAARPVFDTDRTFMQSVWVYLQISSQEESLETSRRDLAEDRLESESLRARTEELETLLKVNPIAIFVAHDPACLRITANPAGYRLVGMPVDSQSNISQSAPAQERPSYRAFRNGVEVPAEDLPMQKAARLGIDVNEDALELRLEDGTQKFIYVFAKPLFDSQGRSRGAVGAMLDITERRRIEEQLERSNQKLNEILASIQDDFYVLDRNWIFVYANELFAARIGKKPEDFIGKDIWEMFPKHIGRPLEENFRAAMEKRELRRFEIPGQYTDAWYRMTAFPSAEGITVLGTDITEHKRTEKQLRYQATLLANVNDAIIASDAQFRITAWNSGAEALYGWRAEEVIGNSGLEIIRTEWPGQDATEMRRVIAERGHWRGEATQVRKDGSRFPVEVSSMVLRDEDGQVTGYVSVNRDITERKRMENVLRENERQLNLLNETLEQKVYEKTAEVRQLAADLIRAVQRERQRISRILHDDLQQRIYAIQMQLSFLRDELPPGNERARQETSDIKAQLDEILAVTRQLSIDLSPPILHEEGLSQAINWLASQMRKQYNLPIELQADEAFAIPNEELHVLLFNCVRELLFNIVKHADASRAVVALQRSGDRLRIEVSDDGRGFPVPRADQADKEENAGTGLGLYAIHHQLTLFGGEMEIRSKPGGGTRVILSAPIAEEENK